MRPATKVDLTDDERLILERTARSPTAEQRMAFRARVVLAAANGESNEHIAAAEQVRTATVCKWRIRFAHRRVAGLNDGRRSGRPVHYGPETEDRILRQLDEPVPDGYAQWNGRLVAEALGDVSVARQSG